MPEPNITFEKTIHAKVEEDIYNLIATRAGLRKTTISAVAREILTAGALSQATAQTVHEEVMALRALVVNLAMEAWRVGTKDAEGKLISKTDEDLRALIKEVDPARFRIARRRAQEAEELRG